MSFLVCFMLPYMHKVWAIRWFEAAWRGKKIYTDNNMDHWSVKCGYCGWGCSQVKSHCSLTSSPNTRIDKDVIVCPSNYQPCNSLCTSASFHFLALLRNIFSETGRVGKALLWLIAVGENYLNVFWRVFQCEQQKCSSWIEMNKEAHKFVVNNQGPSSDDWNSCRTEEIVEADAWQSTRNKKVVSEEEESCFMLWLYSEKLAVFFGLITYCTSCTQLCIMNNNLVDDNYNTPTNFSRKMVSESNPNQGCQLLWSLWGWHLCFHGLLVILDSQ
jgi:hypothetical protein